MPVLLTAPTLEVVLKGLHDSEIRYAIQNEPPVGGITAWIDFGNRTEKATFYGTIVGISTSGQQPIASRRGCTRPRCASSLIAPMPKRTAVDQKARALRLKVKSKASVPETAHPPDGSISRHRVQNSLSAVLSSQPPKRVPFGCSIGQTMLFPESFRIPTPHGLVTKSSAGRPPS